MYTMDVEQMRKIRAQYIAHVRTNGTIGGYDLFDIYLVLYVLEHRLKGVPLVGVPFQWVNKTGGFGPVEVNQIASLSDLLVVENSPGNLAGSIVRGLTPRGVQFLKSHLKELIDDFSAFSITEQQIMSL